MWLDSILAESIILFGRLWLLRGSSCRLDHVATETLYTSLKLWNIACGDAFAAASRRNRIAAAIKTKFYSNPGEDQKKERSSPQTGSIFARNFVILPPKFRRRPKKRSSPQISSDCGQNFEFSGITSHFIV